jgi:hypothetical protein
MDFCSSGLVWDGQTLFDSQPMAGSHARIQPHRTTTSLPWDDLNVTCVSRLPTLRLRSATSCSWRRSFHSILPPKEGTTPPGPSSYRH